MSYPNLGVGATPTKPTQHNPLDAVQTQLNTPLTFSQNRPVESYTSGSTPTERLTKLKLGSNSQESRTYESLAILYSTLNCLEQVESCFMADIITYEDYYKHCSSLLQKYRMWYNANKSLIGNGLEVFASSYNLPCSAALARIREGTPAEIHTSAPDALRAQALLISVTEGFITLMDVLNMSDFTVETLAPQLSGLSRNLEILSKPAPQGTVPSVWAGGHATVHKILHWNRELHQKSAMDTIEENEARQQLFDLGSCYQWFKEGMNKH